MAAGYAPAAIGTETDGSVICPSAMTGLVGLKPTIGLVPRTHIVPISHSQDTAGPMARGVRDVAMLFSAMIASDPEDPATKDALVHRHDYAAALDTGALRGLRVGVVRMGGQPAMLARFEAALAVLRAAGADLVEVAQPSTEGMGAAELRVLEMELKSGLAAYLATTAPDRVPTRTLADVIAFNKAHAASEMALFGQDLFEAAEATGGVDDPAYADARATSLRLAGRYGIDAMLTGNDVRLLVMPSYGPAWLSDTVWGDQYEGPSATARVAIAGYPHLTVPMGLADGLPVGLSFVSGAFQEQLLLNAGYAYEQAAKISVRPSFSPTVDAGHRLDGAR